MTRPVRLWCGRCAAGVALAAVLTSCGVPSGSSVVVEGQGQAAAPAFGDDGTSEPDGRDATTESKDFVQNFLAAAAGDPKEAVRRVREFIAPDLRGGWSPSPEVQVVRLADDPIINQSPLGYSVELRVTLLGQLDENGVFLPAPAKAETFRFNIADNISDQTGLFVVNPPSAVLLSDTALQTYFEQRTIYFWSKDHRVLVPDLRYLPRRDVPAAQRPTLIVDWLLQGPSPWLKQTVEQLPQEARAVGKVPAPVGDVLKVVLQKAVHTDDSASVNRLATQLRWSLRSPTIGDPKLELRVDQVQRTFTDSGYLAANPAYRGGRNALPCGIVRGEVRQLKPVRTDSVQIPEVPGNRQVVKAALANEGGRLAVALVKNGAGGQLVLDVAGGSGSVGELRRVNGLRAASMSQPVWLPDHPSTGLVVADRRLVAFRASGGPAQAVQNSPAGITAFSVAPDGYRLAYVANGRLFVALLRRVNGAIAVDKSQPVPTTLTELTGVGWSQQDWLVISGQQASGLVVIRDITLDGALQAEPRGGPGGTRPVVHLVASTDDPVDGRGPGEAMYVANDLAFELFTQARLLKASDVVGPSPSPSGQSDGSADPTYPFFVD